MGCLYARDTGTATEKGLILGDLKEVKHSEKGKSTTITQTFDFDIDIKWHFTIAGLNSNIPVRSLTFSKEKCQFWHKGFDDNGKVSVMGDFDIKGNSTIQFKHDKAQYNKVFRGNFAENSIEGEWEDQAKQKGPFKIELLTEVWKSNDTVFCIKNQDGIGYFPYGWAILSNCYDREGYIKICFADGKTGSLRYTHNDQKINATVSLPSGSEDKITLIKNR